MRRYDGRDAQNGQSLESRSRKVQDAAWHSRVDRFHVLQPPNNWVLHTLRTHFAKTIEHPTQRCDVKEGDGRAKDGAESGGMQFPTGTRHAERHERRSKRHEDDLTHAEQHVDAKTTIDESCVDGCLVVG